ncbi:MAG TPA: ABC transporter substrate-binding protein [Stellaceae bacterium]|nr:ABC transporter substrate-binding protein [Stellaceae bacterium]
MTRRRDLLAGLGIAVVGRIAVAVAQTANPQVMLGTRRVAAWIADSDDGRADFAVFLTRLSELGWQQGHNLEVAVRQWNGDVTAMRTQADELLAWRPDVILAQSNPALAILRPKIGLVPTVFVAVADPVGSGLIENLARPGGNITGFTNFEPTMGSKWLEVLKETVPQLSRVLVLMNVETPVHQKLWMNLSDSAPTQHVEAVAAHIHDAPEIEQAIVNFAKGGGGVVALPHPLTVTHAALIIRLAIANRMPSLFAFATYVQAGALVSYGIRALDEFRRAADYVDRILRGVSPSQLPVQGPTQFELAINLKTAKALGLVIPQNVLAIADEVIEQ